MKEITTVENAQQFLCTVASSDIQFEQQPACASVQDILEYTLQTEIIQTASIGSYSGEIKEKMIKKKCCSLTFMHLGLLQILFLAGVSEYAIQQHCEEERDGYNTTLFPLSGSIKGTIHVMWIKFDPEKAQNHIIPLLMASKFNLSNGKIKNGFVF